MDISYLNQFETRCKLSWLNGNKLSFMTDGVDDILVSKFSYTLTQYTPSVYAIVQFLINEVDVEKFNTIENLDIKDRKIEINFSEAPYNRIDQKIRYFQGPFKFIVVNYTMSVTTDCRLITLHCVDEVFYKMARVSGEKFKSFGKVKISDIVSQLVKENGGTIEKLVDTDYSFRWLQTRMSDFKMIKSLLPYSRTSNGMDIYSFFMFNNKGYFAPITFNKLNPVSIPVNNIIGQADDIDASNHAQQMIEKYGSLDNLYITHHGYSNFKNVKPKTFVNESFGEQSDDTKQHAGVSTTYISTSIEDETLNEIYVSCFRHRLHTFNRILKLNCYAVPDITPLDCVKLVDTDNKTEKSKEYDGIYYVNSVTYNYGDTTINHNPTMSLVLTSETNVNGGTEKPEGQAIVKSEQAVQSVSGSKSAKNTGVKKSTSNNKNSIEKRTANTTQSNLGVSASSFREANNLKAWENKSTKDVHNELVDTYSDELSFKKAGLIKSDAEKATAKEVATRTMESKCTQEQIKEQYNKYPSDMQHITGYKTYSEYKQNRKGTIK